MIYEYWFACIKNIADGKKRALRRVCGSGKKIYYIEENKIPFPEEFREKDKETLRQAKRETDLEDNFKRLESLEIRFVPYFDSGYPKRLSELPDPPYAVYVKGELPEEGRISAAIVGARGCTPYGEAQALEYGEILAQAGIQIVSGMAKGIDGAGQRGALNGAGKTYAVLGCGVDVCYPREHIGLYMDIQKSGGILSELRPGEPPLPFQFPRRNRIISGLSDVILVMEAREKSGSLITADLALEQGKDVYALPGPVTSLLSQGCHRLIRQGAGILVSPQDLLEELHIQSGNFREKTDVPKKVLETPENLVYSCLDLFPKSADELIRSTGIPPNQLFRILTGLEIDGCIKEISKNYYIRAR